MSKIQFYIGTDLLDFNGIINVKRQINDYRDTNVGASNKSYTVEIPLTPGNVLKLGFINDIRSRVDVTDPARIVMDGIEVIRGTVRILNSTSLYAKIIVEADDWIDDVKGISIRDLSWSGDDHSFTAANISASWTAGAGAFYRYPLINFAELYSGDYADGAKVYPYDFYPTWNIEDIVRKIFAESGYTVAANSFFDGTFGQKLYQLSAPAVRNDDFIAGKNLDVRVDDDTDNHDSQYFADTETHALSVPGNPVDIDNEVEDEGGDFSTGTNQYTAPEDGTYRFQASVKIYCSFNKDFGQYTSVTNSITFRIRKNSATLEQTINTAASAFDVGNETYTLDTGYIFLEAGDVIDIYCDLDAQGTLGGSGRTAYLYIESGTTGFLKAVWSEHNLWPGIDETMSPTTHLPDIDTVDFLRGLKKAYNLRFWMDRANRTIYIETSNDFYGSTVIDWSDLIDYSETPSLQIVSSNYTKTQKFRWKPDTSDKAYINYVSGSGVPGEKELTLGSAYALPGTTIRENPVFSPTILGNMNQIRHYNGKVPKILGSEEFISYWEPYPAFRPKTWLSRIFEWKGMVSLTSGSWDWHTSVEDASATNYTTFPSMETPSMVDMYSDYWSKDFRRIDKNKILTCKLKIKPYQIIPFTTVVGTAANEGFRAKYKLNLEGIDMYFIMSRIITNGDLVKCEFMQIL